MGLRVGILVITIVASTVILLGIDLAFAGVRIGKGSPLIVATIVEACGGPFVFSLLFVVVPHLGSSKSKSVFLMLLLMLGELSAERLLRGSRVDERRCAAHSTGCSTGR